MIELGLHLLELLELLLEIDVEESCNWIRSPAIESAKVIRKQRSSIEEIVDAKSQFRSTQPSAPTLVGTFWFR